jgi:6-phosphogluconolactonase
MKLSYAICSMLVAGLVAGGLASFAPAGSDTPDKLWVFVGTYTDGKSKGIYRCELNLKTGKLSEPQMAAALKSPSFLAVHPSERFLYAVNEGGGTLGKSTGAVSALSLDPKTGALALLNEQPSGGSGPCHLVVDRAGRNVLAANYGSGSCCCIPIKTDGLLAEPTSVIQHKGTSIDKSRQEGPHAHSINVDAKNRFAFCCDLGLDKVLVYRFDAAKGTLTPNDPPALDMAPGSGPRHFAFHPDGKTAYVCGEMAMTITACDYDADKGILTKTQTLSTLPKDADRKGASTAEVVVHPSGKFVYVSNRGHNSIAIFAIDAKTRVLTAVGHQSKGISTPRNFAIEPSGQYMLVANQSGDSVIVFRIDAKTGELTPTGTSVDVPAPVCVRFVAVAQ